MKLTPVRDAFTHVFGRATTQGIVRLIEIKHREEGKENGIDSFRVFNRMLHLNQSVSKLDLKVLNNVLKIYEDKMLFDLINVSYP